MKTCRVKFEKTHLVSVEYLWGDGKLEYFKKLPRPPATQRLGGIVKTYLEYLEAPFPHYVQVYAHMERIEITLVAEDLKKAIDIGTNLFINWSRRQESIK